MKKQKSNRIEKKSKKTKKNKNAIDEKEFWVNKNKFTYKYQFIITIFKSMLLLGMLVFIIYAATCVGTLLTCEDLKISQKDLTIKFENSKVFDIDGNYVATLSSGTKRECISLTDMGQYLPKAYIAIEDERFYEHKGVDVKRTAAATLSYLIHMGKSDFGGSSITQQVVKNITQDKEDSANRKIKEMAKAMQVEHYLDKDHILELYLNIIFVGGNDVNGVQLGAKYYFNKQAKELSIAQCAFMAGINHSPNFYKPFKDDPTGAMSEKIKNRTKTVLGKMIELNYINEEQYQVAMAEVDNGLGFEKGDISPTNVMTFQTEAALSQIINQIKEEKEVNQEMAEMMLYSGGYNIYTTQKSSVQFAAETELINGKYSTTNGNQTSMATFVVIDHKTGNVLCCSTGIGENKVHTGIGNFNYPTSLRKQTGSCMKPISVIAPGLESGAITGATVFYDGDTTFGNYHPKNYYVGYRGPMTMRQAIAISANIPHVKALSKIGVDRAISFCQSVGIKRLGSEGLALALGGLTHGATTLEMAGAYAAIANDGVYIEPTFYSKVCDDQGNVVFQCKSVEERSKQVMSPQNAFIEKNILRSVVLPGGTATYCSIPGIDVAAKTGTTNNDNDRWLCGFTPYYTAACWFGYEHNATVYYNGNPAGQIWAGVMKRIHEGLPSQGFVAPSGVVTASICKATGNSATGNCTDVYNEVFREGGVPPACQGHRVVRICNDSGLLASGSCINVTTVTYPASLDSEQNVSWHTSYSNGSAPTATCPGNHVTVVEIPVNPIAQPQQQPSQTTTQPQQQQQPQTPAQSTQPNTPATQPTQPTQPSTQPTQPSGSTPSVTTQNGVVTEVTIQ